MKLFLSVGAMKAGTTWLYDHLHRHPQLYFTPEKEIHFLDHYYNNSNVLSDENRLNNAKNKLKRSNTNHIGVYKMLSRWYGMYLEQPNDMKWYERVFSLNGSGRYNCDFSNLSCHVSAESWYDLKTKVEDLKVIYIIRDPLKRYWSHIKFHHEFIGDVHDFSSWSRDDFASFLSKGFMQSNGNYSDKIKTLTSVFGPDTFKLIYFESMVGLPEQTLREIEDFLNIDHIPYDSDHLSKATNISRKIPMPVAFLDAVRPLVAREIDNLVSMGIGIPDSWTKL